MLNTGGRNRKPDTTAAFSSVREEDISRIKGFYQVPRNSGALYDVTQTIDTYVYNALMQQGNISLSSAAGFYQSIVGFALVLAANARPRRSWPPHSILC